MTDQNRPAFSKPLTPHLPECEGWESEQCGLTASEYAAIHLRVPSSGTPWLDDMIRQRLRYDFAGQAMLTAKLLYEDFFDEECCINRLVEFSYSIAEAMLAERKRRMEEK